MSYSVFLTLEKCFCMGRRFDVAVVDIPGKG